MTNEGHTNNRNVGANAAREGTEEFSMQSDFSLSDSDLAPSLQTSDERSILRKATSGRWMSSPHSVKYTIIFSVTVWVFVTFVDVLLLSQLHRQATLAASDRVKQIAEQVVRAIERIDVAQAYSISAAASYRVFMITVSAPSEIARKRPEAVPEKVWAEWIKLVAQDSRSANVSSEIFIRDGYIFQWVNTKTAQEDPILIHIAIPNVHAYKAFHTVRAYSIIAWVILSIGIIVATITLVNSLLRSAKAEEALKLSETSLRARESDLLAAQSVARFGSWRLELADGSIHPSLEYTQLFETAPENFPRNIEEWISRYLPDPADAADARVKFKRAHEASYPYEGTRRVVLDSGKIKWLQYYARPVFDAKQHHTGFFGIARDVTDERMAAEKLAASEERFRVISENMQDIITLHARDGTVLYASPSLKQQIGHRTDRAVGNSPLSYVHPDDHEKVAACIKSLLNDERRGARIEYRIRGVGGQYTWLETSILPVLHESGKLRHFQAVSRDISARKAAESALASRTGQLSAANRQLVREVARRHELERRVLLDIEMEMAQVGLELHDELGQDLTGIALLTKNLERKLQDGNALGAADAARISELTNRAIRHTRMISHGLSPYIWGESGLTTALAQLANDIDSLGVVSCIASVDERIQIEDEAVTRGMYRIAQEATNNALKHSGAKHIRLSLKQLANSLQMVIADDGTTQRESLKDALDASQLNASHDLHSIRHRAQTLDAAVRVRVSQGRGTVVRITIPLYATLRQAALNDAANDITGAYATVATAEIND
jgi:PAS domain S-box-containing protein